MQPYSKTRYPDLSLARSGATASAHACAGTHEGLQALGATAWASSRPFLFGSTQRLQALPPRRSSGPWYVRHPEIAIRIEEIRFAQAMRFVRRCCQDGATEPPCRRLSRVRVATMQAQFSAHTTRQRLAQTGVQWMRQIGVVVGQHPRRLTVAQHRKSGTPV